jgi:hypothetical protein
VGRLVSVLGRCTKRAEAEGNDRERKGCREKRTTHDELLVVFNVT